MSLDPYKPCPCGSGKKIKFCCSKDMVNELEKVVRASEGEQRAAALDQIERLIKEKGARDALLALKADLQLELDDFEGARATVSDLLKKAPHNPVALAFSAIMAAMEGEVKLAVERLQESLEAIDETVLGTVYASIDAVAQALLATGDVFAARGHWRLQAMMAGDRDQRPAQVLTRLHTTREIPLLFKEDLFFDEAPADAKWRGEFEAAMKSARRGMWLAACESLCSLSEKAPHQLPILKNIAILRSWLGQNEEAAVAWRHVARLDSFPLDDQVECEALAQALGSDPNEPEIEEVKQAYRVADTDALMETLLSDKRVERISDPLNQGDEEQPPPKAAFLLLDRAQVTDDDDIQLQDIPRVVGEIYLFGKQTDREARLEFVTTRTEAFSDKVQSLQAVVKGLADQQPYQQVTTDSISAITEALSFRCRLPRNISRDKQRALIEEQRREMLLEHWTQLPLSSLQGKTPQEAAESPDDHVALLAAILLMRYGSADTQPSDFVELRKKLGLPESEPIDPAQLDVKRLPLVRLERLMIEKLTNEQLMDVFRRAYTRANQAATRAFGREILQRQLPECDREDVYDALVKSCDDSDEALQYVTEAREFALAEGRSPARWLLNELSIRLPRMEVESCSQLVNTLQSRHLNEPGVAEGLYRILVAYGVISPDGQPGGPPPEAAPPTSEAAAAGGKLWTPNSAAEGGEQAQKSKLWVPGMD